MIQICIKKLNDIQHLANLIVQESMCDIHCHCNILLLTRQDKHISVDKANLNCCASQGTLNCEQRRPAHA